MIAAFSGFMTGRFVGLQEFGLGLSAAIFLDATIVRVLLVPSLMKLLGDWNWYLPERVRRAMRLRRVRRGRLRLRAAEPCRRTLLAAARWRESLARPPCAPTEPHNAAPCPTLAMTRTPSRHRWQPVWARGAHLGGGATKAPGRRPRSSRGRAPAASARRRARRVRCPTPTCSRCSRTRAASRTWGISSATRSATPSPTHRRRHGNRVLHPMGYDSFGLPAENHAIKTGVHPRESTRASIESFRRQFHSWGISIDWSRELATSEPSYYRWTQWIFLQLYRRRPGLSQGGGGEVVPQRPDRARQRAGRRRLLRALRRRGEVRQLEQWFFRITDYAERLLRDLDEIDWPEHVKTMQRNWIGRSEGAEVIFRCEELGIDYPVFTTRPDTLFGATFFVLAPEHPDVLRLAAGTPHEDEVGRLRQPRAHRSQTSSAAPSGSPQDGGGARAHRDATPSTARSCPMYVADYVLMEYGTGAIMAVPAHDERDYAFARTFGLPDPPRDRGRRGAAATPGDGPLVNSHPDFDGRPNREAHGADRGLAAARGEGTCDRLLPPARLADLAPALLGLPDPDHLLRALRRSCRCPRTTSRCGCPRSRTTRRAAARRSRPPRTG